MTPNKSKLILALDSSSRRLTFAVGRGGEDIISIDVDGDFRHAETIIQQIDVLLKKADVGLDEIDTLACGVGPGSFTGLRVGLAVTKALVMSKKNSCYVVSSLDVIARNALENVKDSEISSIRVLVDARRSRYYTALYRYSISEGLYKLGADTIMTAEALLTSIERNTVLLGDGLSTFPVNSSIVNQYKIRMLSEQASYPRASEIIKLVTEKSPFVKLVEISGISPAYLRPTEPEERLMDKTGNTHG